VARSTQRKDIFTPGRPSGADAEWGRGAAATMQADAALESLSDVLGDADLGSFDDRMRQAVLTVAAVLEVDGAALVLVDASGQVRVAEASDAGACPTALWQFPARHDGRRIMTAPVRLYGRAIGSLKVVDRGGGRGSPADRRALDVLAGAVAACLRIALDADRRGRTVDRLRRRLSEMSGDGAEGG
jgi:hypothetical protein